MILAIFIMILMILIFLGQDDNTGMKLTDSNRASISIPENTEKSLKNEANKDVFINSSILKSLVNNSWNKINANLLNEENEDYILNCTDVYVNSIIFNKNYKDSVVSDIKVGTNQKKIIEILGTPNYEDKEIGMIGYKTEKIVVFFYSDEIAIYSNKSFYNAEFEKMLFEYFEGSYEGNRTNFVVEIRRNYPDFSVEMSESSVILSSISRQIKIRLNEDKSIGIYIYKGYNYGDLMKEHLDESNIIVQNEDYIEEAEKERKEVLNQNEE